MSERAQPAPPRRGGTWRRRVRGARPGWWQVGIALLLLALAAATLVGSVPGGRLEALDRTRVTELRATLGRLADGAGVVVGFDADVGTYPEIRPAVRRLLRLLVERGLPLTFVSLTPEGRALAGAELAELGLAGSRAIIAEPRWISGAEAGLVRFVDGLQTDAARPGLVVVVGGIDLGPRAWVEQAAPRLPGVPLVGVAPTALRPELEPYRASGQLAALIATLPDLTALAAVGGSGAEVAGADRPPSGAALLLGMLVAIVFLVLTAARPWLVLPWRGEEAGG